MRNEERDSPAVERVRKARAAIARECDYDLGKMAEYFKKLGAELPARINQSEIRDSKNNDVAENES